MVGACALACLGACATITRGTDEAWTVQTDPSGATVKTTAGYACDQTPCSFRMRHNSEFDVTITKPGYLDATAHVSHHVVDAGAAGFLGNALIGGVIGAGVDVYSGATQSLRPNPLVVKLERKPDEPAVVAAAVPPPAN